MDYTNLFHWSLPIKEYNFNRFTYWGKMNNFNMLQNNSKKNGLNGFTSNLLNNVENEGKLQKIVMNYKDYKSGNLRFP